VIPLQDALNKTNADRLVAAEFMALPQRYMIGIEPTIDPDTGRPVPMFVPGADRVWQTANPDAKFGQFDAAELSQLREEATDLAAGDRSCQRRSAALPDAPDR